MLRKRTDNALRSVFKPQHGRSFASTVSVGVCVLSVCRRWMCTILILDLITDFIRIILHVFRGGGSFSSIIIQCFLVGDRGSCYHKTWNANNTRDNVQYISRSLPPQDRGRFIKFSAQSGLGSTGKTEGSCREGTSEIEIMRMKFFSEVEQAEVMLGNHEKSRI